MDNRYEVHNGIRPDDARYAHLITKPDRLVYTHPPSLWEVFKMMFERLG